MKLSKSLMFSTLIMATLIINPSYAAHKTDESKPATSISSAEMGTLATVAAIDKNEILIGVVASNKKLDSSVTDFAKMMIDQHGDNLTQILEMVDAHPLTSSEADKLAAEGKAALMKLGAMQSDAFAAAYVNAMVKGHEAALNLIDQHLMKTAKSEEVKKFLTDTRAAVATHLEHAKQLQEKMKS